MNTNGNSNAGWKIGQKAHVRNLQQQVELIRYRKKKTTLEYVATEREEQQKRKTSNRTPENQPERINIKRFRDGIKQCRQKRTL